VDPVDLAFAGIARQAELVRGGEVSSRELVELYLERIGRIDPELNSFRAVLGERAIVEADQADSRRAAGDERPLLGVPVAVKDNVDVAGEVTTHGTGAYGLAATEDAEVVRRLRGAGAIVIGKTNLPELAISGFTESATWGITRNPWNGDRTPGGSSGGSGAAVAAGLVGAAHASDGAGSIRVPAACCGLFGLKPQRGRVSLMPDSDHWHGLTVFGCVTRTVLDSALFLDVVMGNVAGDADRPPPPARPFVEAARSKPGKLRVAVSFRPLLPTPVGGAVKEAVHGTADLLRSLGHDVLERDAAHGTVSSNLFPRYLRGIHDDARRMARPARLERRTRGFARLGRMISPDVVVRARAAEARHSARINAVFEGCDVLMTPVTDRLPVEVGRWEGLGALRTLLGMGPVYPFTGVWNVTGQPAAAVPAGFTSDGLPLSVQLIGRPNDEVTLISLAAQLESERGWPEQRPTLGESGPRLRPAAETTGR
jgi:amidase